MHERPATLGTFLVVAMLAAGGCAGLPDAAMRPAIDAPLNEAACTQLSDALPDLTTAPGRALPAITQSVHTNGVLWLGANAVTVHNGTLSDYDSGDGFVFGVAFGNESLKEFFEVSFEMSKGHQIYGNVTGVGDYGVMASATVQRFYFGFRTYLRPVTGQTGRAVPFAVTGVALFDMHNEGPGQTPGATPPSYVSRLEDAGGFGIYLGTGVEVYLSAQVTLGADIRATYWNWEGLPEATGENGTGSCSVSLYYHF
jgi:hypothetical protein